MEPNFLNFFGDFEGAFLNGRGLGLAWDLVELSFDFDVFFQLEVLHVV